RLRPVRRPHPLAPRQAQPACRRPLPDHHRRARRGGAAGGGPPPGGLGGGGAGVRGPRAGGAGGGPEERRGRPARWRRRRAGGGVEKAWAKAQDPQRRAKIGAAHRGKRLSAQARRQLSRQRRGRPLSPETRRKMAEAHRGRLPCRVTNPWTAAEDELVRTLPPAAVARRTGRTLQAVYDRRTKLGVAEERGYNGSHPRGGRGGAGAARAGWGGAGGRPAGG